MIILYDENEMSKSASSAFTTLGIGVLTDAITCVVTEELNGQYELEMEYPITGKLYKEIQNDRFIKAKPNDTDNAQPFRIYKITRPIDGVVTVYAEHISYMAAKVPVRALNAQDLDELISQVNSRKIIDSKFNLVRYNNPDDPIGTKNNVQTSFQTKVPYALRSLLGGSEGSILDIYGGEYLFDNFNIILKNRRGRDRDYVIRYSKNMIDLEHETSSEKMFNGICPYYNSTTTETKVSTTGKYKEIYLSTETTETYTDPETGEDLHPKEWLSYNPSGGFIDKVVSLSVTNIIATEGDLFNHLVRAKYVTPTESGAEAGNYFIDVTYNMAYIDPKCQNEFGQNWLAKDDSANPTYWSPKSDPIAEDNLIWNPYNLPIGEGTGKWDPNKHFDLIFRIYSDGDKKYHCYLWKETSQGSGQYAYIEATDADGVNQYLPALPSVNTVTEEKENILTYEGDIIYIDEKRAIINPEYEDLPFPPSSSSADYPLYNFFIEVKEEEQYRYDDDRFVPKNPEPEAGSYTEAYPINGANKYTREWLSATQGSSTPLTPTSGAYYKVNYSSTEYVFVYWDSTASLYLLNSSIKPYVGLIIKVPALEEYIDGYPIEGAENYTREWLSATQGSSTPLTPINQKGYLVHRNDGKLFYYRWEEDSEKYVQMNDRRYTYTNIEVTDIVTVYGSSTCTCNIHDTSKDAIYTIDLTEKFEDVQKEGSKFQKYLYDYTIKYIDDNSLGKLKESIKVSFIKLSSSPEYTNYKELEKVYLGDSVHVIYEESGINVIKQVIKTEYNVLKDSYNSIELGEKSSSFVNNVIVEGDDISSLTNDRNFADIITVTNLVAQRITADYIKSVQADITEATIQTLTADSITAAVVEAQRFEIDQLVAQLLVANDALIRQQLTVGDNLIVNGEINIKSGSIKINGSDYLAKIKAYENPNALSHSTDWLLVSSESTEILNPSKYTEGTVFEVFNSLDVFIEYVTYEFPQGGSDGHYETYRVNEDTVFEVNSYGKITANDLEITGGSISISPKTVDAEINPSGTQYSSNWLRKLNSHNQYEIIVPNQYTNYKITTTQNNTTTITYYLWKNTASSGQPENWQYVESLPLSTTFNVDPAGNIKANSVELEGYIKATSGSIDNCEIESSSLSDLEVLGNIYLGSVKGAYERTGAIVQTINHIAFGDDGNYKDSDKFGTILANSNLHYTTDYADYWEGDDDDEYSDQTFFYKDRVIKIPLDVNEYFIMETDSGNKYSVIINGTRYEHTSTDGRLFTSVRATSPQTIKIIFNQIVYVYNMDIYYYTRGSNWLSETSSSGDALTPQIGLNYRVATISYGTQYYQWNSTSSKYEYTDVMYISDEGINLIGISSTYTETIIGGFKVTDDTLISTNNVDKEVGLSSDISSDYAIWAGIQTNYEYPFYVTHEGEMHASKGSIANITVEANKIYTNDKSTITEDEEGFYLGTDGFAVQGKYTISPSSSSGGPVSETDNSSIMLKPSGAINTSYISNMCLYNPKILSWWFDGSSSTHPDRYYVGKPIISILSLTADIYPNPTIADNYTYLPKHSWTSRDFSSGWGKHSWKKIYYAAFCTYNTAGGTGNPDHNENVEFYWDNSNNPGIIWIYNGNGVDLYGWIIIIGEREDVELS